jgi:hypothetical protein
LTRNQLTSPGNEISPFEKLFGKAPDVSKLRVWGCPVAYLRQAPRDATGKFGPRALRGNLVGYGAAGVYENGQLRHALGYVIAPTMRVERNKLQHPKTLSQSQGMSYSTS